MLSADQPHHRYLVWLLRQSGFDVVLWLVEPEAARRRGDFQKGRWVAWLAALYHLWRRKVTGLSSYREGAFALPSPLPDDPQATVRSLNDPRAQQKIAASPHDITIIIGCGILAKQTLELCGSPIVNVHCGFLPDYRGNHCIYFAHAAGDYGRIGATLHHVDVGIDTGDIIENVTTPVRADDLPEHLYCRLEHLAFGRLISYLDTVSAGASLPRFPQPNRGRTYRTRDRTPLHDMQSWWRRRRGRGWETSNREAPQTTAHGS